MEEENAKWPLILTSVPKDQWPHSSPKSVIGVQRSRNFLVQIYQEKNDILRLSVCRTLTRGGMWMENITWDDLQNIKKECGYGDKAAVEIFPPDNQIVNVANMRHIWVLDTPPDFMWKD